MNLTTKGAFYASRRGGTQFRGWDAERYALVAIANSTQDANWISACVNRNPDRPAPKRPERFPTPDEQKKPPPKPGSFAAMVVAAKKAALKNKEKRNGQGKPV